MVKAKENQFVFDHFCPRVLHGHGQGQIAPAMQLHKRRRESETNILDDEKHQNAKPIAIRYSANTPHHLQVHHHPRHHRHCRRHNHNHPHHARSLVKETM